MRNFKVTKLIFFIAAILAVPFFALAVNDVSISQDTNFQLNTSDTATLTTLIASAGGQVTNFDVQVNYIDITLDNLSSTTFTTTVGGQYLKITKLSGSNDYTVTPACPTNTVTLIGTGATVVLRLQVQTTDPCTTPPPPPPTPTPPGGGGGGVGYTVPPILTLPTIPTTIPIVPPPCLQYMTKYIKLGAVNDVDEVKKLQIFLRDYEGFSTLLVTGVYDQVTYEAVKTFQLRYTADILTPWGHTAPTGYVFQTTLNKINEIYCKGIKVLPPCIEYMTKHIKLGAINDPAEVRKLQIFLKDYEGFSTLPVTGVYDQSTFEAVKIFQVRYTAEILTPWGHTAPTGYVFQTTIKKINEIYCQKNNVGTTSTTVTTISTTTTSSTTVTPSSTYNFTRNLTIGSRGADVTALQQILINGGYMASGYPFGYFGSITKTALIKYQLANGITPAIGYFGPITRAFILAH